MMLLRRLDDLVGDLILAQAAKASDKFVQFTCDIAASGNHCSHPRFIFGGERGRQLLAELGEDIFLGELGKQLVRGQGRQRGQRSRR